MTFDPSKINLQQTCQVQGRTTVCVTTKVCFKYRIKSDKKTNTETGEEVMHFLCFLNQIFQFLFFKWCFAPASGTVWLWIRWERLLEDGLTKRTTGSCWRTSPSWTSFAESTPSTRRQVNQSSYTQESRTNFTLKKVLTCSHQGHRRTILVPQRTIQ